MKITLVHHAEPHERFAAGAFDSQIGKEVPVRIGADSIPGRLVAAVVSPDGTAVKLTIETPKSPFDWPEAHWSTTEPSPILERFVLPADWRQHVAPVVMHRSDTSRTQFGPDWLP